MNLDALQACKLDSVEIEYSDKDSMLYALSIGACANPDDLGELGFAYEKDLVCLPSFAVVLAHPGMWMTRPGLDVDVLKLLHGEQRMTIHRPLPPAGKVRAEYAVSAVVDKGEGKGALMYFDKTLYDAVNDELLCTVTSMYFLRGDGGCGSFGSQPPVLGAVPEREPDFVDLIHLDHRAPMFYRLNGDRNPIHIDPELARKAGFPKPIAHGLLTYGVCGLSVLRKALNYDVKRMASHSLRFSSVVFPGEPLEFSGWQTDGGIAFRVRASERDKIVVDNGFVGTC